MMEYKFYLRIIYYTCFITYTALTHGTYLHLKEETFEKVNIRELESFSCTDVFEVVVQPLTVEKQLLLKLWNSPNCQAREIVLQVQHGTYPLCGITNTTMLSQEGQFYPYRSEHKKILLNSTDTYNIGLPNPLPGSWFISIYALFNPNNPHKTSKKACAYFAQLSTQSVIENVQELSSDGSTSVVLQKGTPYQVLRFWIDGSTWSYYVNLTKCSHGNNNCPVEIYVRSGSISSSESQSSYVNCSKIYLPCEIQTQNPQIEMWQYITLKKKTDEQIFLDLDISLQKTVYNRAFNEVGHNTESQATNLVKRLYAESSISAYEEKHKADDAGVIRIMPDYYNTTNSSEKPDVEMELLDRVEDIYNPLNTSFYRSYGGKLKASVDLVNVYRYDISSLRDIGGFLVINLKPSNNENKDNMDVVILVCIQRARIPVCDGRLYCIDDHNLHTFRTNNTTNQALNITYPYPEPGPWFLGMQATCHSHHSSIQTPCTSEIFTVEHKIGITTCPACNNGGLCRETIKAHRIFAYCSCIAGYQGLTCEEEAHATPTNTQKIYTYFLTLSNLFFIPAIGLAIYRRYYVEALVYFSNMFFSSFYHACDVGNWSKFYYCILPYNVLKFTDFMLSLSSFWMTFLALAQLPHTLSNILQVAGIVGISIDVAVNATGIAYDAVPICLGGAIVLLSWFIRCAKYKTCYPSKWRWCTLIPGFLIAATGIIIFTVVETQDNYPYTHSVWHICMSTSILFLLPGGKQKIDCTDRVSATDNNYRYAELTNVMDPEQAEQTQNMPVVLNSSLPDYS